MRIGSTKNTALVSVLLMLAGDALAQRAPPLPAVNPGRIEIPDERGIRTAPNEMPGTLGQQFVAPPAETPIEDPPEPGQLAIATPFMVRSVRLEGSTVYPPETFRELLQTLEGRQVTLGEVQQVARQITRFHRFNGYLLTRTFVPAQDVTEGNLVLRVESRAGSTRSRSTVGSWQPIVA